MKMAVIGSGYVGTVTGACMAEMGHEVICTDIDGSRIHQLQKGELHIHEKGLMPLLQNNVAEGRLTFTEDIQQAVKDSDVIFLCIGTKGGPSGKADRTPLTKAVKDIAACMKGEGYKLIVEKSTLPIQTGEYLKQLIDAEKPKDSQYEYDIAAVPQFMREGNAIWDFMHPDRVIIGTDSQRAIDILVTIYRPLNPPMLITDINSAELIKHATNAFLAMKISFINSIGQICEKTGADVTQVAKGLGMDKRISPDYLKAGIGYGGIFFPKDIHSLVNIADEYHIDLDLLKTTENINRYQRISFIERIEKALPGRNLHGKTIGIWGLAFRPNTDDMRDAPSVHIIRGLENRGAVIKAYDPIAIAKTKVILPHVSYHQCPYETAKDVDALAILTEWTEFAEIDFQRLKKETSCRLIIDGRNMYSPQRMKLLGFKYISIGRQPVNPN